MREERLRTSLPRSGNGDEVDRLIAAFNTMATRLDVSFQQVREFMLQASHELKTPLTVMRAQLETALREGADGCPDASAWVRSRLEEVQRLARIVETLTLMTKADAGLVRLEQRPVRLDALVRESFQEAEMLAEPTAVQVTLIECAELTVLATATGCGSCCSTSWTTRSSTTTRGGR